MRSTLLVATIGLSLVAAAAHAESRLPSLAWLCGSWGTEGGAVETWTAPEDGLMLGVNRAPRPGASPFFEYLRIEERPTGIVYVVSPLGREATDFELTAATERSAVFENPQHDYPQRIAYSLDGDTLVAEISAGEGEARKSQTFRWPRRSACECGRPAT